MNKNQNTVVELTEKELECVTGGGIAEGGEEERFGAEFHLVKYRPRPIPSIN